MADETTDTIDDRARQIVDDFSLFDDWMARYEYLIEIGKNLPPMNDALKTDTTRIHGCQSQVWIHTTRNGNQMSMEGDSDAMITKGLAGLLITVLNDQPPEAVRDADLSFIDDIGMREHLSSTRNNGLHAMIEQIRTRADRLANSSDSVSSPNA